MISVLLVGFLWSSYCPFQVTEKYSKAMHCNVQLSFKWWRIDGGDELFAHHQWNPDSLPVLLGWYHCNQLLVTMNMVKVNMMMVNMVMVNNMVNMVTTNMVQKLMIDQEMMNMMTSWSRNPTVCDEKWSIYNLHPFYSGESRLQRATSMNILGIAHNPPSSH